MKIPFLDMKSPYLELREELDAAWRRVMESGWYVLGAEVEAFERLAHHEAATLVRRWDDRAKVAGLVVADLADYRSLLARLASAPASVVAERSPRPGDRR